MRGIEDMEEEDIMQYFDEFEPSAIEWIDDESCKFENSILCLECDTLIIYFKMLHTNEENASWLQRYTIQNYDYRLKESNIVRSRI